MVTRALVMIRGHQIEVNKMVRIGDSSDQEELRGQGNLIQTKVLLLQNLLISSVKLHWLAS